MTNGGVISHDFDAKSKSENPDISLVIPTRNEATGIAECIRRANRTFEDLSVTAEIIVSDSSTDETPKKARELGAKVVHPVEEGYGNAYLRGFEEVSGDIVVMGDGDTSYDFLEIEALLNEIEKGADLVIGTRLGGTIHSGAMPPLHQYVGNPLLTRFLNAFYGMDVTDAHSGFRAIKAEALEKLDLTAAGMEFASEMLIRARANGFDVREVPITYHQREGDAKLRSLHDGWRHVEFMLVNAPGELFLFPGLSFVTAGVIGFVIVLFDIPSLEALSINTVTASSLLILLGSHVLTLGASSAIVGDPIRDPLRFIPHRYIQWIKLEHVLAMGLVALLAGSSYAVFLLWEWVVSGFNNVPTPAMGLLTMTVLVLAIQSIFQSLFISILRDTRDDE